MLFAHVILTMLSSKYLFWGVHNPYQAKSANSILESKVKLVCFSFFIFRFSFLFFFIRFTFFIIRFCYLFFTFGFSLFVFFFHFSFFIFHFSFFGIQNQAKNRILTLELRQNIVFLHLKSYFDIHTGAEYRILTFKILF